MSTLLNVPSIMHDKKIKYIETIASKQKKNYFVHDLNFHFYVRLKNRKQSNEKKLYSV